MKKPHTATTPRFINLIYSADNVSCGFIDGGSRLSAHSNQSFPSLSQINEGEHMESEQLQNDIDTLLIFMNDILENSGMRIQGTYFSFKESQDDRVVFDSEHGWEEERLFRIINICHTRNLVNSVANSYARVLLTEEGQSRALSVKHGKKRSYELGGSSYTIGAIHVAGSAQVGDGNTLNIHNVFQEMITKIDNADATPEEKAEVKSRLSKFLEHPLTSAVLGGAAGSIFGLL